MTGKLADIRPADLLHMINSARKTGAVHLSLKEGKALIFFREREIVFARSQKHRQKKAVYALLDTKKRTLQLHEGHSKGIGKVAAIGEFMVLMMDGMQRFNET
jgi:CRP/FNR family transcriptional regulator, cyclic AMP receptor protein